MPGRPARDFASSLKTKLHQMGLKHLRVRARGPLLNVESGPDNDPIRHVRFRRDTVHLWLVEMPSRGNRWERTPFRGYLDELAEMVADAFPWTLAEWPNAERTTDLGN